MSEENINRMKIYVGFDFFFNLRPSIFCK
jgi:hypothetical protein